MGMQRIRLLLKNLKKGIPSYHRLSLHNSLKLRIAKRKLAEKLAEQNKPSGKQESGLRNGLYIAKNSS